MIESDISEIENRDDELLVKLDELISNLEGIDIRDALEHLGLDSESKKKD
jgi:hypothetical protein